MMKCKQYASLAIISIIIIFVSVIGLAIITIMTINVQAISDPQSAIQSIPVHNRVAMINFDDGWVSQYILGKPILDEFGYKASYFLPCAHIGLKDKYLSWAQVAGLSADGMDIESHTMTHAHLPLYLDNIARLSYEIAGSKQCFDQHGYRTNIFGYPLNLGIYNPVILGLVGKSYAFARSGDEPLFILNCNYPGHPVQPKNCQIVQNHQITYSNVLNIKSKSFYHIIHNGSINYSEDQMFLRFQARIAEQAKYNTRNITAIPIITYHDITNDLSVYNTVASTITTRELQREMQYLHDNQFRVITLKEMLYIPASRSFAIQN